MFSFCVLLMIIPSLLAESIILLDLPPEEAQKYISGKSLDLSFAKMIEQASLSQYARDNQEFYHQGELIENPDDFLHTKYEASQFQAQDGLGRSMFGYTDWNQGRLEARNANGEIRGSYQFVDPNGENVMVNYWSDSLGYHQTDNRQKSDMEAVTETPEVRDARLAHARAWEAAAKAALENPDPLSDTYNENANRLEDEQSKISEVLAMITGKRLARKSEQSNSDVVAIEANESEQSDQVRKVREDEPEEKEIPSNPRGFYFNIEYPVNVVSLVEASKKFKRSDESSLSAIMKDDQIALENEPKVAIVTAAQPHPILDERIQVVDAITVEDVIPPQDIKEVISAKESDEEKGKEEVKENKPEPIEPLKSEEPSKPEEPTKSVEPNKLEKPIKAEDQIISEKVEELKEKEPESHESKEPAQDLTPPASPKEPKPALPGEISESIIEPKTSPEPVLNHIPVEIKIDESPNFAQKSAADAEAELRKLATNEDVIDGIHDAQVHPKQLIDPKDD